MLKRVDEGRKGGMILTRGRRRRQENEGVVNRLRVNTRGPTFNK